MDESKSQSGATIVGILLWAESGRNTLEKAERSCRTQSPGWRYCTNEGFIKVADGKVALTEAGKAFLGMERFSA